MYNLLIVDDEQTIRSGLKSIMDWESLGIRVAGDVRHGREALDFMMENKVHLVITDLKMPIMDGMELTAKINTDYPDVKMVILSGYDDFEYARQAIKNNVQDYLLKPVSLKKLHELMASLSRDLDEMYSRRESAHLNDRLLNEHQFEIRHSLFKRIGSSENITENDRRTLVQLGLPERPKSCRVIICASENGEDGGEELRMIAEVLEETRNKNKILVPFLTPAGRLALLLSAEISVDSLQKEFIRISGGEIAIGVGTEGNSWNDMERSFMEADTTFRARPFINSGWILEYDQIPSQYREEKRREADPGGEADALNLKLTECLLKPDVWAGLEVMEEIAALLASSLTDFRIYRQETVKTLVVTAYNLKKQGVDTEGQSYSYSALLASAEEMKNTDQLKRWSQSIVRELCANVSESKEIKYKPLVKKAIAYMEERYRQPLKIEEVAEYLGISSNYLSRIFKEETELSFLNWLNSYRVDRSVPLLADPAKKIYEISEEAGFSDYRYYNKVFKKFKGVSPREYRKS